MFLNKNNGFNFLIDIFLKDLSIKSIFIHSWDCIYVHKEDFYEKMNYSFCDNTQYIKLVKSFIDENETSYYKISQDVEVYVHSWNSDDFWITLKRISTQI